MTESSIWAVIAVISFLSAVVMVMFAWRLNDKWQEQYNMMLNLAEKINESIIVMNEKWSKLFVKVKGEMYEKHKQDS